MKQDANLIQLVLDKLLKASILEASGEHKHKSPLTWYRENPARDAGDVRPFRDEQGLREDLGRVLHQLFGHIDANPSDPFKVERLQAAYAYPDNPRDSDSWVPEAQCPNRTPGDCDDFLDQLGQAAQRQRAVYEAKRTGGRLGEDLGGVQRAAASRSKFILIGDRGAGKTIFLNHMLSTRNDRLHECEEGVIRSATRDLEGRALIHRRGPWRGLEDHPDCSLQDFW